MPLNIGITTNKVNKMKKITFLTTVILLISSLVSGFAQEKNKLGVHLELGYSAEFTKLGNTVTGPHLLITPLYAINNNMSVGVGSGIKLFSDGSGSTISAFPLYAEAQYKFDTKKIIPYIEGKLGYQFINKNYTSKLSNYFPEHPGTVEIHTQKGGGFFFSPAVGVFFPIKGKQKISLSAAYLLEQDSFKAYLVQLNRTDKGTNIHHSVALRIGYTF